MAGIRVALMLLSISSLIHAFLDPGYSREIERVRFGPDWTPRFSAVAGKNVTAFLPAFTEIDQGIFLFSRNTHPPDQSWYISAVNQQDFIWSFVEGCFDHEERYIYAVTKERSFYRIDLAGLPLETFEGPRAFQQIPDQFPSTCYTLHDLVIFQVAGWIVSINTTHPVSDASFKYLEALPWKLETSITLQPTLALNDTTFFGSVVDSPANTITLVEVAMDSLRVQQNVTVDLGSSKYRYTSCSFVLKHNNTLGILSAAVLGSDSPLQFSLLLLNSSDLSQTIGSMPLFVDPWHLQGLSGRMSSIQCAIDYTAARALVYVNDGYTGTLSSTTVTIDLDTLQSSVHEWPASNTEILLAFPDASTGYIASCLQRATGNICKMLIYSFDSNATRAHLVSSIELPNQPYSIAQMIPSPYDPDIVFAYSLSQNAITFPFNESFKRVPVDVLILNCSDPSNIPLVTFSFDAACDKFPLQYDVVYLFELDTLRDSLRLSTYCETLLLDWKSLQLLQIIPEKKECVTDRDSFCHSDGRGNFYCPRPNANADVLSWKVFNAFEGSCSLLTVPAPPGYSWFIDFVLVNDLLVAIIWTNRTCIVVIDVPSATIAYTDSPFPEFQIPFSNTYTGWAFPEAVISANASSVGIFWFYPAFSPNRTQTGYAFFGYDIAKRTPSVSGYPAWWTLPTDGDDGWLPSVIAQSGSNATLLWETGQMLQISLPSGVIMDQVSLPLLQDYDGGYATGAMLPTGAIYLVSGAPSLPLLYTRCPAGHYRDLPTTKLCLPCPPNSVNHEDNELSLCESCPPHTTAANGTVCLCSEGYYSSHWDTNCQLCPPHAICTGNNSIVAASGYWKGSDGQFYACPFPAACDWSSFQNNSGCAIGYTGPACGECAEGYGSTLLGCTACHRHSLAYSLVTLSAASVLLLFILIVLWRDTGGETEEFFGIFKTVLSFLQVLSFSNGRGSIFGATPRLAAFYSRFQTVIDTIGLRVMSFTSLDCVLRKSVATFYIDTIIVGFAPIVLSAIIVFCATFLRNPLSASRKRTQIVSLEQNERNDYGTKKLQCSAPLRLCLFLFLLTYPPVTSLLLQFFQCQRVDGVAYLVADFSSTCYNHEWNQMLVVVIVLGLLYGVAGPLAMLVLLRKYPTHMNLNFVTSQYRPQCYYWDVVELFRKLVLLIALAFDQYEQQTDLSWYSGLPLTISVIGLVLHAQVQPFKSRLHQHVHTASLVGVFLLYAVPAITPTNSLFYRVASIAVLVYLPLFTVSSVVLAIWVSRSSIWKFAKRVFFCCSNGVQVESSRGDEKTRLITN